MKKNLKTTLMGIATLILTGLNIWANPAAAATPETLAGISAGIGLILAQDSQKQETPAE